MTARAIRFGLQLPGGPAKDVIDVARRAEAAGFDIVLIPDHVGTDRPSPMPILSAVAQATERVRVGTFVLNACMRNPVQLAWEAATLAELSGGRFELGLGAGHTPQEFAATGIPLRTAAERKRELAEVVEIIRGLLDGHTVDHHGEVFELRGARVLPDGQRVPILVGGNGTALLQHAAQHADIVGLQGLSRVRDDGFRHQVRWTVDHLASQVETIEAARSDRELELNALVQRVEVGDDREATMQAFIDGMDAESPAPGAPITVEGLTQLPYAFFGTHDDIAAHCEAMRDRWGITYFVVRELDKMAPVVAAFT